jgi:PAS domain S-box-containing protein
LEGSHQGSTFVSPENSEDGALDSLSHLGMTTHKQLAQAGVFQALIPGVRSVSANATPTGTTHPTISILPPSDGGDSPQYMAHPMNDIASKRRRVDHQVAPMAEVGPTVAVSLIGQQQLAVAAAQALQGGGRSSKSQQQIDRRRERNRILAKRTRLRKKFFFEAMQKEIMDLQRENMLLKDVVKTNLDVESSTKILDECDAMERMPEAVLQACGPDGDMFPQDFNLVTSIQRSQHSFVISDPSLQDNPIVFASDDFLELTGYEREDVLGRNCRFLQGTETSKEKVQQIRKALSCGEDVTVTLVNYMADGTPFWNKLFIASLRDAQDSVVNYIAVIVKVPHPEPGDPEHGIELPTLDE